MYDQGMQNGSQRQGKSVLESRVEKNLFSGPQLLVFNPSSLEINKGPQKKIFKRFLL